MAWVGAPDIDTSTAQPQAQSLGLFFVLLKPEGYNIFMKGRRTHMNNPIPSIEILRGADVSPERLRARIWENNPSVGQTAADIIADVRERGDAAVREYTLRFDGVDVGELAVDPQEIEAAFAHIAAESPELIETLELAAANIGAYHKRQLRQGYIITGERDGVITGQRIMPLERVGLYIPGGTAAYPSTVLMNAIPAKLAGVGEICLASPPQKDGKCDAAILAAARIAGVGRVFRMGGAQAIAALAFGTGSVPRVDKITGPGNIYVSTAKKQLYGVVDIEMIAGPSEVLIIADDSARARFVAADMLAQAEHDAMAAALLITTDPALADAVKVELSKQLETLPRREIAERSLAENCRIAVTTSLEEAVRLSDGVAPEHLKLCVRDPFALLGAVRHAGSVFLGAYAPEALGDYLAGPNHTLPTNGAARFASPLSVDDFVKKSSFTYYTKEALQRDAAHAARFARQEQFEAHARSVEIRFE
ncbi:MAG: histidinol dehydrogenase [Oscillospiraceae bacterium]|nr:histidinol dehydrogenase [Oscillospiraceae bacterium]